MIRLFRLYGHYCFGLSLAGFIAFVIQELPYIVMPLIDPASNPIMNMQGGLPWLERAEGIAGMLTMVLTMLVFRDDKPFFSLATEGEKACFAAMALAIAVNFAGWACYYLGYQAGWLMVLTQFAMVPLYYLFFGLWKGNLPLAVSAAVFFVIHTANGVMHFMT